MVGTSRQVDHFPISNKSTDAALCAHRLGTRPTRMAKKSNAAAQRYSIYLSIFSSSLKKEGTVEVKKSYSVYIDLTMKVTAES
jgi:hypothetical protein